MLAQIDANWTIAVATVALVLATIALAWLTLLLVRETRKTREQQSQPDVIVTVEQSRYINFFELVIENVGAGAAYDVKITPPTGFRSRDFDVSPVFSVALLKSRSVIRTFIGNHKEINLERQTWAVDYADKKGQRITNRYEIDLSFFRGISSIGTPPDEETASALKKIAEDLQRLVSGFKRLRVDVYSNEDRAEQRRKDEAWREERLREQQAAQNKSDGQA